jgi:hypothetical protein
LAKDIERVRPPRAHLDRMLEGRHAKPFRRSG